jgi:hypothetical protein
MRGRPFAGLGRRLLVPGARSGKRAWLLGAAALLLAGCGGSPHRKTVAQRQVEGAGYAFAAPAAWDVQRSARTVQATPKQGPEIVSVSTFPLLHAYRPELWARVVPELDRVAGGLAGRLGGRAGKGRTETIAGRRSRTYEIAFTRNGKEIVERLAFVLEGKREFQLLCRWDSKDERTGRDACDALTTSFRLSAS